jgi:hypothetical protein
MMPKTKVFAVRPDRLGGRLSAIINAKRLADMFDLDLQVFWSKPQTSYPELVTPEAIFSPEFIADHFLPADTVRGHLKFTSIPKKSRPCPRADFAALIESGQDFGFTTREGAVVLPFEELEEARSGFATTFRTLGFSDAFRLTMDHIDTALASDGNFVAVHIRRGDVIRNPNTSEGYWYGQYVPDAIYFQVLDALYEPEIRFVFFCDDPEVLAKYQARYEGALAAAQMTNTNGKPALHVDLAEMYLMSRCTRILGPRSSAYSTTAADLSAAICEPVEDLLTPKQMRNAISQLASDIKTGVSAFHSVGDYKQSLNALMTHHKHATPEMTIYDVAKSSQKHGITTTQLLETALTHALNSGDLSPISFLEEMVQHYDVQRVSANGDSYAALSYAHFVQGNALQCSEHLVWANWFYPESAFVSYVTSALASDVQAAVPYLNPEFYANLKAISFVPPHKEMGFLQTGPLRKKIDKEGQMKNHIAPFMIADWLEFVNPKARKRMQTRSYVPRDLKASPDESLDALMSVIQSAKPSALVALQAHAKTGSPIALKRLATGYFRIGKNTAGLQASRDALSESDGDPLYLAALAVRLQECGYPQDAVNSFEMLCEQKTDWAARNPSVNYAHAQALFGIKDFTKSAEIVQRNLDFANSCLVSGTLQRQLKQYF